MNDLECAIEAKSSDRISDKHLKGLRELKIEHPKVKHRFVVCTEQVSRTTSDGIKIISYKDFVERLWSRTLF